MSSAAKAQAALASGADEALIYPSRVQTSEEGRALTELFKRSVGPAGADVIYDPVGGSYADAAISSIGWGGRYLTVGFPAGIPKIPLNLPLLQGCDICGVYWGEFARRFPEANAINVAKLFRLRADGKIEPKISRAFRWNRVPKRLRSWKREKRSGKL